jgi:hypothetical protein
MELLSILDEVPQGENLEAVPFPGKPVGTHNSIERPVATSALTSDYREEKILCEAF